MPGTDRPADHTMLLRPPDTLKGTSGINFGNESLPSPSPATYPAMIMRAKGCIEDPILIEGKGSFNQVSQGNHRRSNSMKCLADRVVAYPNDRLGRKESNPDGKGKSANGRAQDIDLIALEKKLNHGNNNGHLGISKYRSSKRKANQRDKYSLKILNSSEDNESSDSDTKGNDAEVLQKMIEKVEKQLHVRKHNLNENYRNKANISKKSSTMEQSYSAGRDTSESDFSPLKGAGNSISNDSLNPNYN